MKGQITYQLLKFIENGIFMNLNFIEAVAVSGYGASYKKLDERLRKLLPRVKDYKKEIDGVLKIIAFDIPEREKSKRRWLCSVLKNLGFEMRQKSVWVGRSRLPVYFIKDISRLGLLDCVDIFEVAKKGSLNDLNG